jgi:hypothetical protein
MVLPSSSSYFFELEPPIDTPLETEKAEQMLPRHYSQNSEIVRTQKLAQNKVHEKPLSKKICSST